MVKGKALLLLLVLLVFGVLSACAQNDNANVQNNNPEAKTDAKTETNTEVTPSNAAPAEPKEEVVVNIGIQQSIWPILAAREKGWFEEEFSKVGAKVKWVEFQSGPAYFESFASGRLDFGRVGNIPVLAGQAAKIGFKEIATASQGEKGDAILVPKGSPIQKIQDLKGKQIAVAKGSSAYGLLYKVLEAAGLKPEDVKIIQLQPDEGQPAFETGKVDAWAIWEPFQSIQVLKNGARVLANGETVGSYTPGFQLVRTEFAEEHPELVVLYLKVTEKATRWQLENKDEAITFYAQLKKQDNETMRRVLENSEPSNVAITQEIIDAQQGTADLLLSIGGLKEKLNVSEVVDNTYIEQALKELKAEK
ncbi:sulfonate ABC transporter substrate-binding protein [Paenibacillus swuensis]|uniref:Putative aliphatic sulfonates-binding protein n=2 Tax=Paenibacillus swuensis TaxID=1178515 RepID=A0A172TED2_9BACL|nr:sulfonate ABC transporter substrate-binding protein [Paenibacillus swuensis]